MTASAVGNRAWTRLRSPWWAAPVGAALAAGTLARGGFTADAVFFAAVQLALVALAVIDLETRRLPNVITVTISLVALALRALFERRGLETTALAGVGALVAFGLLAILLRGGIGMGDAKLAGMLGFVLGSAVVPGLVIGVLIAGAVSVCLLVLRRVRWNSAIAYGPYLALGGAIAILLYHPPPFV
jgi:leader peptidase (prepilin peptidase)/N-methyltransferase